MANSRVYSTPKSSFPGGNSPAVIYNIIEIFCQEISQVPFFNLYGINELWYPLAKYFVK